MPGTNEVKGQSFAEALKKDKTPDQQEFRETMHTRRPVIQPSEDNLTW